MRKILLLLLLIGSTFSVKAQLFGYDWKEGSYYDIKNNKHTGLLANYIATRSILGTKLSKVYFKTDKKADKITLKSKDIQSYIVINDNLGIDSFIVSHNDLVVDAPFLKVVLDEPGKSNKVFVLLATQQSGPIGTGFGVGPVGLTYSYTSLKKKFFYGPDQDHIQELTKKNFKEVMIALMADEPDTVALIEKKKFKLNTTMELVTYYLDAKVLSSL